MRTEEIERILYKYIEPKDFDLGCITREDWHKAAADIATVWEDQSQEILEDLLDLYVAILLPEPDREEALLREKVVAIAKKVAKQRKEPELPPNAPPGVICQIT